MAAKTVTLQFHKTHKNGLHSYRIGSKRTDAVIYVQRLFDGKPPAELTISAEGIAEPKPEPEAKPKADTKPAAEKKAEPAAAAPAKA